MKIDSSVPIELQAELRSALLSVNRLAVREIFLKLDYQNAPLQIVQELVVPTLDAIGVGWEQGEYSLSQVYMAGRICEEIVDTILPPAHTSRQTQPKMAIVTLEDYHQLGKRIVYSTLRASGFELMNLGRLGVAEAAAIVKEEQIKILLISVLMLPSALRVKDLRKLLDQNDVAVKIVVGGAPFRFDANLWLEVQADACGSSANDAVEIVRRLVEES